MVRGSGLPPALPLKEIQMKDRTISCPHCGKPIQVTDALAHEIEAQLRVQYQEEIQRKEEEFRRTIESKQREFREAYNKERSKIEIQARQHAEESVAVELKDAKVQLQEKVKQLEQARQQELDLRKRQRELEDRERDLQLQMERTLDAERKKIWSEAVTKTSEEQRLRELEKDKQLSDMRKQIEELKHKAELTSQQIQGEVQELELEHLLGTHFRFDQIDPVAKGARGADALQIVHDESGNRCGAIIWESKRTKAWSDSWLQKLKDDQRNAKAELAVIVTAVLPKEINRFGFYEGVWICDFQSVIGLATALRLNLIQVSYARNSMLSRNDKVEIIYKYISGTEFRQRVEAIVEAFTSMREDLQTERTAMERIWSKREKQIERVVKNTAGLYGDLQGIIGTALPDVKLLGLPALGEND